MSNRTQGLCSIIEVDINFDLESGNLNLGCGGAMQFVF